MVARVDTPNIYTTQQTFTDLVSDEITTNRKFRNNGTTILNGTVTFQGKDLQQFFTECRDHRTDYTQHITSTEKENI